MKSETPLRRMEASVSSITNVLSSNFMSEALLRELLTLLSNTKIVRKEDLGIAMPRTGIDKLKEILPEYTGDFPITSICRDDLEALGYDISDITDDDMRMLAENMANDYGNQLRLSSLEAAAEYLSFPKKCLENPV